MPPRRSVRISIRSPPTTPSQGKQKRVLEDSPEAASRKSRRKGSRNGLTVGKSSPKRSKYFENIAPDSSRDDLTSDVSDGEPSDDLSDYSAGELDTDNATRKPKGSRREATSPKTQGKKNTSGKGSPVKGKELWREGVRTGLGPGKEVFIELHQARDAGDDLYEDQTIHPNTMFFLKELKANNERGWFKRHDSDYRTSKKDWDTFVESLTVKIAEKDSTIPELPAKDLVFRIYRDIRFSKDQTPYKPHFSAAWSRTGRKGKYACYYVHLEPGSCFIGGGLWMPESPDVGLIRQDVDRNPERIKRVLNDPALRKEFFNDIPNDERKAVKAFVSHNQESALKKRPKGWDANHRDIDLLRLRSYTLGKPIPDEDLLGPEALDKVAHLVGILVPLITYLNNVVMPDPEDSDNIDEEDNDSAQDEDEDEDEE